jgi:AAA domain
MPEQTQARQPRQRRYRHLLKLLATITMTMSPNYLVKGILPRVGLAVVWGPPKCGKSFWVFDLVMHIAIGREWRGHRVHKGAVVYLALEGGGGFANRIEAWRRRNLGNGQHKDAPFYLLDQSIDLVTEYRDLIESIQAQLSGGTLSVLVIDTLNRALIGDENDSKDMAKFIRAVDAIRATFDCLVLVVHHCGIVGTRPRGHTSLAGANDTQIRIERDKDGTVRTTIEHAKDGEAGAVFASKLERVELGPDSDGDQISSCVIVPSDDIDAGPKLTKTQRFAYEALKKTIDDQTDGITVRADSELANKGVPIGARACRAESWRFRFYQTYPADKLDTKKKALLRATLDLEEAGHIGLAAEYVYLLNSGTSGTK